MSGHEHAGAANDLADGVDLAHNAWLPFKCECAGGDVLIGDADAAGEVSLVEQPFVEVVVQVNQLVVVKAELGLA